MSVPAARRALSWGLLAGSLTAVCPSAQALEPTLIIPGVAPNSHLALTGAFDYTDNVQHSAVDRQAAAIAEAGADFGWFVNRPRLQTSASGSFQYLDYLNGPYGGGLVGGLSGNATVQFIPQRFSWVVEDNFGQVSENPYAVETPHNRQNFNVFSTGPDLTIPLTARNSVILQGRAEDVRYSGVLNNSREYRGLGGLSHRVSPNLTVSANYSWMKVDYAASDPFPSYKVQEEYLTVAYSTTRTTVSADVGYSRLDNAGDVHGGTVARLSALRKLKRGGSFRLECASSFTNSAAIFQLDQGFTGIRAGNVAVAAAADPIRTSEASAIWSISGVRTTLSLSGTWRRDRHITEKELDDDAAVGTLNVSRALTPRWQANVGVSYQNMNFVNTGTNTIEWQVNAGVGWQINRQLVWRLTGIHDVGQGYLGGPGVFSYTEVSTSITWSPRP